MLSSIVRSFIAIAGLLIDQGGMPAPLYAYTPTGAEAISANQPEYTLGDTAVIYGVGFAPGASVIIEVVRSDGSIVTGNGTNTPGSDTVVTDGTGAFTYWYIVEGPPEAYASTVTANARPVSSPGTVLATTTFIDGTQYLLQGCSKDHGDCTFDGAASGWAGGTSPMTGWTAGNLKGWFEGDNVPYRLRVGLRDYSGGGTTVYVSNEHDNLRSGILGIDGANNFYVGAGPDGSVTPEGKLTKSCTDKTVLAPSDPSRWRLVTDPPLSGCIVTGPNFTETDDDGDGRIDEDPVDGIDNDGDGRIDEDPPRQSGSTSVKRIQYVWAVPFASSETGNSGKKWALYWTAHLAAGSHSWPGSSIHAHTTKTGSSDVPISDIGATSGIGADLSIVKTDSPDPVFVGQSLTYTITVSNAGPNTATGVTVSDTLPTTVTFASATSTLGTCSMSGGVVTCSIGTLASGASATVTIVVTPFAEGTLSNTAIVSSATSDPTPSNNTAGPVTTTVNPSANLSIIKSDSPDPVLAGQNLTYTITVGNGGPSSATGVTVTDTLSPNVTLVSVTPSQGTCSGTATISCAIGTLANGANATVTIVVTPSASAVGTLSNTATVSSPVNDPVSGNNSSTTTTTVNPAANLSITKSDSPDPVLAGQNLTYSIAVTNGGPSSATGVSVSDTLPANVTLVSATPSQGSCSGTTAITCALGTLANGASATVTIVVTPSAAAVGTLSNTASVTSSVTDPNTGNNSWTTTTTVDPAADLSITKTDSPDPVLVGNNLTYTITVTNNGPNTATGVTMTDTLPAGVNFVSVASTQGSCSIASGTVTCNVGAMNNNATVTITIVVSATVAGTLNNTACAYSGTSDPTTVNNCSPLIPTTVNGLSADLAINKTVSGGTVTVGQNLSYTITVTNLGPNSATGVTVSDTLPAGVSYVSAIPSQGSCSGTSTVNCSLGILGNGASAIVTITVTATASGTVTNTASVGGGVSDPNSGNNSASVSKTINAPPAQADLSITKTDSPDPVSVNGTLTYTITVTNNGPDNATGVSVTDTLPAGVSFTSATPSQGSCSGTSTVTCNLGGLSYPGSATVTIVVTVTPSAPSTITNPASVSSTTADPVSGNNSASTTTTVLPATLVTDLVITQVVAPSPAQVGDTVTFTITVTNNGPDTATGVTLTDTLPLPANATFGSVVTTQGTCGAPSGGIFTCSLGTIAPGSGNSVTITLVVTATTTLGMMGNTASVAGVESETTTVNNSASAAANVGDVTRLLNISTRAPVLLPPNGMNGGFILGGSLPKTLLIRGRGPSLSGAPFNISGTLANPTIRLVSAGTTIAQNDNWQTTDPLCLSPATACGNAAQITATAKDPCQPNPGQSVAPPNCSLESALLVTLPPGPYSVVLSGVSNGTGVGLFEVFDVDSTTAPKLNNISTRGLVQATPNLMHGGFIIGAGTTNKQVLIRARGPSMSGAPFNVPGTLTNPTMRVVKTGVTIAQNDDWQTTDPLCGSPAVACGNAADITATGKDPCVPNPTQTVAPPNCANEAALLLTLPPGGYNVVISGVGNTQGLALFEVFDLTP